MRYGLCRIIRNMSLYLFLVLCMYVIIWIIMRLYVLYMYRTYTIYLFNNINKYINLYYIYHQFHMVW